MSHVYIVDDDALIRRLLGLTLAGAGFAFAYGSMAEELDVLVVARALIEHFGAEAAAVAEQRAEAHRRVEESEGLEFWQSAADAVRVLLKMTDGKR